MDLSFDEVTKGEVVVGYISEAVSLTGNVFGVHLEFEGIDNKIEIFRKVGGDQYVSAKSINFVGKVFDMTFTDAMPGMSIKIKSVAEPDVAEILQ